MTELPIFQGGAADFPLQAVNRGGLSKPAYSAADTLTCYIYQGQSEVILTSPAVAWYTANSTQTGYDQGQVLVSITNAQSALLEQNGTYLMQVWWWPAASPGKSAPICRVTLQCKPAAGAAVQTVTTYCQLKDMLEYLPWVSIVQDQDTDQEGFYSQRLQAREWFDQAILNCFRGSDVGLFEEHSYAAFAFGYAGWRRSLGPSPALIGYLAANNLILRPQVIRCCAWKSISQVGLAEIGINNQFAVLGMFFAAKATQEMIATTAEVDINGDGIGEFFINLGTTNTLMT